MNCLMCGEEITSTEPAPRWDDTEPEVWDIVPEPAEWVHASDGEWHCYGKASVATPDVEDEVTNWGAEE